MASTTIVETGERRSALSCVRSSSSDRLDSRSDPPSMPIGTPSPPNTGIVRTTIGSPDTRDDRTCAMIGRWVAHRVLEVVAVGDVAVRVARAVLVVDDDDGAVERDHEDAGEQRRQDALALDELSEPVGVADAVARQLQGDAAQGSLQADQPQRHRRRDAPGVVFLRIEDDLLAAAADLAQDEDQRQGDAGEDQQCAGQREADLQRAKTERFPEPRAFMLFGTPPSLSHLADAKCVKLLACAPNP